MVNVPGVVVLQLDQLLPVFLQLHLHVIHLQYCTSYYMTAPFTGTSGGIVVGYCQMVYWELPNLALATIALLGFNYDSESMGHPPVRQLHLM